MIQVFSNFLKYSLLLTLPASFTCILGVCLGVFKSLYVFAAELVRPSHFFTTGDFALRILLLSASVCVCVCLCVSLNHEVVHAVTHDPLKLGSQNLEQRSLNRFMKVPFCAWGGGAVWASCGARVAGGVGWGRWVGGRGCY